MICWQQNIREGCQRMNESIQELSKAEMVRIDQLIQEFKEKFVAGTSDADNFISISQIELLWSELQNSTNNIYSDMIRKMMSKVNESDLIRKKKDITASKE
jgi:hypothetical protein